MIFVIIAFDGQFCAQAKQNSQVFCFLFALLFSTYNKPRGQTFVQIPQPTHLSVTVICSPLIN
ncbi:hypothetical protein L0P16_10515 [Faecalibacillus intestinalis]|nr:hypothetical protein [Faecalibacillus intestinalis]MCG4681538.1 hypothetical protein [Faecalibacillus intestinalis]